MLSFSFEMGAGLPQARGTKDRLLSDAAVYALANPEAVARMAQRLGEAARAKRLLSYSDFARGEVLCHPFQPGRQIVIDLLAEATTSDQLQVLEQVGMHLAWQSFRHTGTSGILANALLTWRNKPTEGFFQLAEHLRKFPHRVVRQEQRDLFWTGEVRRVFDWFANDGVPTQC